MGPSPGRGPDVTDEGEVPRGDDLLDHNTVESPWPRGIGGEPTGRFAHAREAELKGNAVAARIPANLRRVPYADEGIERADRIVLPDITRQSLPDRGVVSPSAARRVRRARRRDAPGQPERQTPDDQPAAVRLPLPDLEAPAVPGRALVRPETVANDVHRGPDRFRERQVTRGADALKLNRLPGGPRRRDVLLVGGPDLRKSPRPGREALHRIRRPGRQHPFQILGVPGRDPSLERAANRQAVTRARARRRARRVARRGDVGRLEGQDEADKRIESVHEDLGWSRSAMERGGACGVVIAMPLARPSGYGEPPDPGKGSAVPGPTRICQRPFRRT